MLSIFFKIFGSGSYKPNFGSYSAASDRPNFFAENIRFGSVRLNRYKKYSVVIRLVSLNPYSVAYCSEIREFQCYD